MKKYIDVNSIRFKITLFIVSSVFIVFNIFIITVTNRNREIAIEQAEKQVLSEVERYVFEVKNLIENQLSETSSFARTLSAVKSPKNPITLSREQVISLMTNMLYENSQYSSVGVYWEPNAFDSRDQDYVKKLFHDMTGNFVPEIRRGANSSIIIEADPNGYLRPYYLTPKQNRKNFIGEPIIDSERENLEAPFSSAINYRGVFYGVVRFNIDLSEVVSKTQELEILEKKSNLQLITSGARIIAESNRIETVNTDLQDLIDSPKEISELLALKSYVFYETESDLVINYPISFQNTFNNWFVRVTTPKSAILDEVIRQQYVWLIANTLIFLVALAIVGFFITFLLKPLLPVVEHIENLAEGRINTKVNLLITGSEIKRIDVALNKLAISLGRNAEFALRIGEGEFNESFASLGKHDLLGNALLDMQHKLMDKKTEEIERLKKESIRTWTNKGIAELNEIVRLAPEQVQGLTHAVLTFLIKYLNVNQGAFFVYQAPEAKEPYFEMSSAYAYNKSRKADKIINAKDGLINSCIKERKTIILKEIPSNYLEISSGVGSLKPSFLLLTPLIHGTSILGVIELASFVEMKQHEIDLVEVSATTIAAEIASIKVKENTDKLLKESRVLAMEMAEEEEELRYKLKKLKKEYQVANIDLQLKNEYLEVINKSVFIIEYDVHGVIVDANISFLQYLGVAKEEILGKSHRHSLQYSSLGEDALELLWENLAKGIEQEGVFSYKINSKRFWLSERYLPVMSDSDELVKVLKVAVDITELRLRSEQLEQQQLVLKANEAELEENIRILNLYKEKVYNSRDQLTSLLHVIEPIICLAEFNATGLIQSVNQFFEKTYNLPKTQIIGNNVSEILTFEHNEYNDLLLNLQNDITLQRESKFYTVDGEVWLSEYFAPVKDAKGEVIKIWYVAYPITKWVHANEKSKQRAEKLLLSSKNLRTAFELEKKEVKQLLKMNKEHISMSNALHNLLTVVVYSPKGYIISVNNRIEKLTGLESNQLLGLTFNNLIQLPGAYDDELFWMDVQSEALEVETKLILSEKEIWLSEVYYPIFEDDQLVKVIAVGINITAMKTSLEQQRKIAERVRVVTQELEAEKELNASIHRKSENWNFFAQTYKQIISQIAGLMEFDADGHLLTIDEKSDILYKLAEEQNKHHSDYVQFDTLDEYDSFVSDLKVGVQRFSMFENEAGEQIKQMHIPILKNNKATRIILISSRIDSN